MTNPKIEFEDDDSELEYQKWLDLLRHKINWSKASLANSIEEISDV